MRGLTGRAVRARGGHRRVAEGPGGPAARRSEGLYGRRGGSCHVPCRWRRAASRCLPSRGADGRARACLPRAASACRRGARMTAPASTWPVGRARCVGATVKSVFFENFLSPKKFRAREKGPRYGRSGSFQAHPAWRFFRRTHPGLGGARRARDRACRTRAPRNFDNDRSPRPSPCLCTPTA